MAEEGKVRTGGCLCGKVKYKLESQAATPSWNTGFTITEGEEYLTTYIDNMTDSGQPLERKFCKKCGSSMFNFTPLYDIVSISAGSLDDFDEWKPTLEQYCIHRSDFLEKAKGVEKRYIEAITGDLEKDDPAQ